MIVWKQITGTDYYVTIDGKVRREYKTKPPRILKPWLRMGYPTVSLSVKNTNHFVMVHTLVLQTFDKIRPHKMVCNHKNGIKTDNRIENLEWVTSARNNKHAYETGLVKRTFFCKNGHEFSKQNPVITKGKGYKRCRICLYKYQKLRVNKDKENARRRKQRAST